MLLRGLAALVVVAAVVAPASAQQASEGIGIERMHPAMDRAGLLDVEWGDVPGHLVWGAGLSVGFAHQPLVVYDRTMQPIDALVDRRLTTTVAGSVGLWNLVEAAAALDIVDYQSGSDAAPAMGSLPTGGVGDAHLLAKVRVVGGHDAQLALAGMLTVPMGGARGYLRDSGVGFAPALIASTRQGQLRGAVNVGYALKPRVDTAGLISDDEAFGRAGLGYALDERATTELWLSSSLAAPIKNRDKNQIALELLVGGRHTFTRNVSGFAGGGVGLDNGYGTPDWRVIGGVRYDLATDEKAPVVIEHVLPPPPPTDDDHDGIVGAADRCPTQPEDMDGFRDDDGCPDDPATVTGRVVDPDGRPLAAAHVSISQLERPDAPAIEVDADADGRFTVTLDGGALHVNARAAEYQEGAIEATVAPGSKGEITVQLVRKVRQGQLRGQVLSFSGQPVQATIAVTGNAGSATAQSDADGNFTVDLPAGTFSVEISAPGFTSQKRNVSIKLDGVTVLNVDMRASK